MKKNKEEAVSIADLSTLEKIIVIPILIAGALALNYFAFLCLQVASEDLQSIFIP